MVYVVSSPEIPPNVLILARKKKKKTPCVSHGSAVALCPEQKHHIFSHPRYLVVSCPEKKHQLFLIQGSLILAPKKYTTSFFSKVVHSCIGGEGG